MEGCILIEICENRKRERERGGEMERWKGWKGYLIIVYFGNFWLKFINLYVFCV